MAQKDGSGYATGATVSGAVRIIDAYFVGFGDLTGFSRHCLKGAHQFALRDLDIE